MTTIKTQFITIHNLLTELKGKKLTKDRFEELEALMISKVMSKTFKLDDDGNVTHVFCYYHKDWEEVANTPYGKKASTSHGLNTMCKQGVSHWTKQQRVMKQAKSDLLNKVQTGEVEYIDIADKIKEIEKTARTIEPYSC